MEESRNGRWSDINVLASTDLVTRSYQTIWFDHGVAPVDASYAYAILPGKTLEDVKAYAASPHFGIVENSADAHAVVLPDTGIRAVNFWRAPKNVAGITSDSVASVLVQEDAATLTVAIADPTQSANTIQIEIDRAGPIISGDDRISVVQTDPTIKIRFNARGSSGRTSTATFQVTPQPSNRTPSFKAADHMPRSAR